jgi:hypothetical protein
VVPSALDEDRHLVRHLTDVGLGRGQHGQARALAGRAHDEEARRHLDDRLAGLATELVARTAGQRLERRRQRGEVLHVRLLHASGRAQCEAILGQEHGPLDVRDPHH